MAKKTKAKKAKANVKAIKKTKNKAKPLKSRDSKKPYKVVQKQETPLLDIPSDDEEDHKKEPESSEEERYMEEFRQFLDEDEIEEEDIGESDRSDAWGEDD